MYVTFVVFEWMPTDGSTLRQVKPRVERAVLPERHEVPIKGQLRAQASVKAHELLTGDDEEVNAGYRIR